MPSQNRLALTRQLSQHFQHDASTLVAPQFVVVTAVALTTTDTFPEPELKDHALIDGTAGPLQLILPAGSEEIIGLPYSATKTDASANAVGLKFAGSEAMADSSTSVTTTAQHGTVSVYWDGAAWRHTYPTAASSGGQAGSFSSLAVGDGTGSPTITLAKSDAGTAALNFTSNGILRGALSVSSSEVVKLAQHDAAGAEVGALSFNATTGAASLSKALTIASGGLTVTAGGAVISAGDLAITLGTLTVAAGGASISGGLAIPTGNVTLTAGVRFVGNAPEAADDAAAAALVPTVPVGGWYMTSGALKQRQV